MLAKLHFVTFNEQLQIGSDTFEIKCSSVAQTFFFPQTWGKIKHGLLPRSILGPLFI